MRVLKYIEPKEIKYDHKAARQRFDIDEGRAKFIIRADPYANNPIDTRLRQLSFSLTQGVDLKAEFLDKWALVLGGDNVLHKGRIKDMYADRLIRIKTRKGRDVIAGFDNVRLVSEREII